MLLRQLKFISLNSSSYTLPFGLPMIGSGRLVGVVFESVLSGAFLH